MTGAAEFEQGKALQRCQCHPMLGGDGNTDFLSLLLNTEWNGGGVYPSWVRLDWQFRSWCAAVLLNQVLEKFSICLNFSWRGATFFN